MGSPLRNFSITRPDGTLKTADELQRDANQLMASARERSERMAAAMAGNVCEGSSRDNAATVTVAAAGALQSVRLSDRAKSMTPAQIAAAVMEAYRNAARAAAERTVEITQTEIGEPRVTELVRELQPDFVKDDERREDG